MNRWVALSLALVLVAVFVGFLLWPRPDPIPEGIVFGNGRIEATRVDVATKIAGRIVEMHAEEGALVSKGQLVARIDCAQIEAQKARAEAELGQARSQASVGQAEVAQARARLNLAAREFKRYKALYVSDNTSQENFEARSSEHEIATANLSSARARLLAHRSAVEAAQAVVDEIQTQLAECTLLAPTKGRVLYRLAEPGELIAAGGQLLSLTDLTRVDMEIFLVSSAAHRVSYGDEARIKLDILDVAVPGVVTYVSPESQFTPKQIETADEREKLVFRVRVRVPQELVDAHIERVKTGVRGVAYIRLTPLGDGTPPPWPDFLKRLPNSPVQPVTSIEP